MVLGLVRGRFGGSLGKVWKLCWGPCRAPNPPKHMLLGGLRAGSPKTNNVNTRLWALPGPQYKTQICFVALQGPQKQTSRALGPKVLGPGPESKQTRFWGPCRAFKTKQTRVWGPACRAPKLEYDTRRFLGPCRARLKIKMHRASEALPPNPNKTLYVLCFSSNLPTLKITGVDSFN